MSGANKFPLSNIMLIAMTHFIDAAFYAGKLWAQKDRMWEDHALNFFKEAQEGEDASPDRKALCVAINRRNEGAQEFFERYQCAGASGCLYNIDPDKSSDCKICNFVRHHTEVNMEGGMFVGYYPKVDVERIVLQALATGRLNRDALNKMILVSGDSQQAELCRSAQRYSVDRFATILSESPPEPEEKEPDFSA